MESGSSRDCNCGDGELEADMTDAVRVTVILCNTRKGRDKNEVCLKFLA